MLSQEGHTAYEKKADAEEEVCGGGGGGGRGGGRGEGGKGKVVLILPICGEVQYEMTVHCATIILRYDHS